MTKKLHVLMITSRYPIPYSPLRGCYYRDQIEALKQMGIKVGVLALAKRGVREFFSFSPGFPYIGFSKRSEKRIPVYRWHSIRLPLLGGINVFLDKLACCYLMKKYIKEYGKPDLIHAHSILFGGYIGAKISSKYQIPMVVTAHDSLYGRGMLKRWQLPYLKYAIKTSKKLICVSNFLVKGLEKYIPREIFENKLTIISNLVDLRFFLKVDKSHGVKRRQFHITIVANLIPLKNVDILIKAFSQQFKDNDEYLLHIAGDGPLRSLLEKLVDRCGIASQVVFHGLINRKQVAKLMANSDLFVLASRYETFGIVTIEAMASGLPVLGTRCGGVEEIVEEDTGLLVDPNSVDAMSKGLEEIVHKIKNGFYDARKIRQSTKKYGAKQVAASISDIYHSVLEEG